MGYIIMGDGNMQLPKSYAGNGLLSGWFIGCSVWTICGPVGFIIGPICGIICGLVGVSLGLCLDILTIPYKIIQ